MYVFSLSFLCAICAIRAARTPEYSLRCLRRNLPHLGVFYPQNLGENFILFHLRPAAPAPQAVFYPLGGSGLLVVGQASFLSSGRLRPPRNCRVPQK